MRSKSGTARTIVRPSDGSTLIYDSHNSAIQITEGNDSIPLYFKSKLVPGVEALPYYSILSFAREWVQSFGG